MKTTRTRGVVGTVGLLLLLASTPALSVAGGWSPPFNLSQWHDDVPFFRLALGADGTQAAFWQVEQASLQWWLGARVRSPGEEWGSEKDLSGMREPFPISFFLSWDAGVAPNGTAWAVWAAIDSGQAGDNVQVWASRLPPGGSWHTEELTSGYETAVRWVDLHIGPDGDLAAAWVACTTYGLVPADGPCHVRVRRRPSGAPNWEPVEQPDESLGMGILRASVLVGPGGLTVALWQEAHTAAPDSWGILARTFEPASGTWDPGPTNLSGWKPSINLAWPVVDPDGNVSAAWRCAAADPSKKAVYASTRPASGTWSAPPIQISSARSTGLYPPSLAVGPNGALAAIWAYEPTATEHYVFASARDPGSAWAPETQLFGGAGWKVYYWNLRTAVWPDGTAMALYGIQDTHRPATEDERLRWIVRPPHGIWGDSGEGELGDWVASIESLALVATSDGRAVAVWGPEVAGGPPGEQWTVLAAIRPPGGPFDPPLPLGEWYQYTAPAPAALIAGPEGQPVAAAWLGQRASDGSSALFYNELLGGGPRIYLPMILKGS
jgi:hypothetical protein